MDDFSKALEDLVSKYPFQSAAVAVLIFFVGQFVAGFLKDWWDRNKLLHHDETFEPPQLPWPFKYKQQLEKATARLEERDREIADLQRKLKTGEAKIATLKEKLEEHNAAATRATGATRALPAAGEPGYLPAASAEGLLGGGASGALPAPGPVSILPPHRTSAVPEIRREELAPDVGEIEEEQSEISAESAFHRVPLVDIARERAPSSDEQDDIDLIQAQNSLIARALEAPAEGVEPVPVFYATDREYVGAPAFYGSDHEDKLTYGFSVVSIPKRKHITGRIERPSLLRLELREDPKKHVMMMKLATLPESLFYSELRGYVAGSTKKQAFVFIHGFNVTFQAAILRTAQIAYDLEFEGAPIAYSWPSEGRLGPLAYAHDSQFEEATRIHLADFLVRVAKDSGAEVIHLIAHSMGNRAVTRALQTLAYKAASDISGRFRELILTAPDILRTVFLTDIAPSLKGAASRTTLYASSKDIALMLSKKFNGGPRAGDSGDQIVIFPGIDSIDVTAVDTNLVGHFYYSENRSVLSDIYHVIRGDGLPRHGLDPVPDKAKPQYWVFKP